MNETDSFVNVEMWYELVTDDKSLPKNYQGRNKA